MENLEGRRVLVSGGTAGIGYATAERLAASGASVFVIGTNAARVEAARSKLGILGAVCDVRDGNACSEVADLAGEEMGGIDALVNCAGVGTIASFADMTPEDWRNMIDTNVTGTFNACKAALPWLKKSPRPDIVNLGSRAGRYAFAGGTGYCASKFAIQGFSEALFLDLSEFGVGVSLVAPGTVATGFAGVEAEPWHLRPEDVAEAILHCLTSHRGANLNWIELRPSRRTFEEPG